MKTYTINRGKYSNLYRNKHASLIVGKKYGQNILTFEIGEFSFSSVIISRYESAQLLKKIRQEG